jgi:hypothetical protein
MFRVPRDPNAPTFDETFKVGFWRWLGSKAKDRHEWRRRRDLAAKVAERNQVAQADEWQAEFQQRRAEAKQAREAQRRQR